MRSLSVPPPDVKIKFALDLNPISSTPPVASATFLPLPKNHLLVPLLCRLINTPFAWLELNVAVSSEDPPLTTNF